MSYNSLQGMGNWLGGKEKRSSRIFIQMAAKWLYIIQSATDSVDWSLSELRSELMGPKMQDCESEQSVSIVQDKLVKHIKNT